MATYSKQLLSGSTQGRPVKVAASATTGTTIHSTGTSSSVIDEVWLYGYNSDTGPVNLTIEYGGTTAPDQNIVITLPSQSGLTLLVPGLILTGTGAAANNITAFAQKSASATITNVTASAGTVTYTAANTFVAGTTVSITGVSPTAYNLQNVTIATASSTQFTVTNAATGTYVSGGTAVGLGTAANLVTVSGYVNRIS